jgi:hypothetical protein
MTAPLLQPLQAAEKLRAVTPPNQPVLSPELIARLDRQSQLQVDHIQHRDRAWDDALAGRV